MTTAAPSRMMTPPEVARRLRVKPARVIGWIREGRLRSLNVAAKGTTRPRFRIDPADLAVFENSLSVVVQTKQRRRRKKPQDVIEFF